jgi:drug/metabolite transporter (DMT)-like permease
VAEVLALLAALAFALGTTLQQRGALRTAAPEGDPRFLTEILHEPVWWCGALLQAAGWVLQAVALDRGSLVVVQSLCTLSLVFALPLGARLTGQHVGRRAVVGAFATTVGIALFVGVGHPQGTTGHPSATSWWIAAALVVIGMAVLASVAARQRGSVGAALFAAAAGLAFAFQAAATKEFVGVVGEGLSALLSSWTTYALILSALAGFALQQSALKTGYLAPAIGASNASTLVASIALGALVFGERLVKSGNPALPALLALALAVVGVILLAIPEPGPDTDTARTGAAVAPS